MSIEDDFAAFRRVAGEEIAKLREENASLRAHAERVGEANDRLVVENAALRAELGWKTKRIKLLSDSLHDIEGVLKKAATSIFLDAFEAEPKEAQP